MKKNLPSLSLMTAMASIFGALAVQPASAATDYWLGGVSSGNWSSGANWLSGNAPAPYDSLTFTNQSGAGDTANNDFPAGTAFDGITFANSTAGSTINLAGNSILLSGATNGITLGITNATAVAETVGNNLALDLGYYTFYSPAGSLSLNGTVTANTGGLADFGGSNLKSSSLTTDTGGLISSLEGAGLIGNTGVGGGFTGLATVSGGTISAYTYPSGSSGSQYGNVTLPAFTTSTTITNIELTATSAGNVVLNSSASQYINTVFVANNLANKVVLASANSGTLVLGNGNGVGGIYLLSATGIGQGLTIGGGTSCTLTAGTTSGGGTVIFGINGTTTGNQAENNCTIKDNGSGGKVTVIKAGTGSMYFNTANTYSGGTYLDQGYLQGNNVASFGSGPVYVASGATVYAQAAGTYANAFYLSPGLGASALASGLGAIKVSTSGNVTFSGPLTLMGAPTTSAPGDRLAAGESSGYAVNLTGQITGTGTLDLCAGQGQYADFYLDNTSVNANNWTGGVLVDASFSSSDSEYDKENAGNQLNGNNLTVLQTGSSVARFDLNGFNDTIGGLSGASSANIQVTDFGSGPSILTLGANNATATFGGLLEDNGNANNLTIVKIGTGVQTLSSGNTYAGNTMVLGGTLALGSSGSISHSPSITISNATFDVSAASSYAGTSSIAMTNGIFNLVQATAISSLAISNSTLQFPLNVSSPAVTVSGTLTTGGSTNLINLTSVPGFGAYPQQIPLIKYGGFANVDGNNDLTNLGVNLPVLGNPVGYLTNDVANGSIDLVLTAGPVPVVPISWNGRANGVNVSTWDILATPDWVTTSGGAPYDYQNTSVLTFDDTAAGTTTVNLTTTVLPGSITVNNTNKAYTFTGNGKISGTTGLTQNGAGTLTLTETGGDNFSGGVTVNNGTVIIDNNSSAIAGGTTINAGTVQVGNNDANGILPAGAIIDNGALVFKRSDTALTVGTVISGSGGTLTNSGSGTVTFATGPNACATWVNNGILEINGGGGGNGCFSNSVVVSAGGELDLNVSDSLGYNTTLPGITNSGIIKKLSSQAETLGRPITLSGGTLLTTLAGVEQFESFGNFIQTVPGTANSISGPGKFGLRTAACYLSLGAGSLLNISCVIDTNANASVSSPPPLNVQGAGTLVLSATNTFTGGVNLDGGVVNADAPENPGVSGPLGRFGMITFGGGTLQYSTNNTFDYSSRFVSGGQYNIDTAGQNVTYVTSLGGGSGSLTKLGLGTLTLGGSDNFGGGGNTVVAGGKLISSTSSDTGNYEVTNDSTLDVQVASVGAQLNLSSLTLGNNSADTSTLQIDTLATGNPVSAPVNVTGALTTNGTVNLELSGTALAVGNFPLISYSGATPFGALKLITSPRITASLSDNGSGLISVTITAADPSIEWLGGAGGNWDINDSANLIWQGINSHVATDYLQGTNSADAVTFDDNATGTTTVNLTTNLTPVAVTVNNTTKNYTFSGTGKISGTTGLIQNGAGTLTLTETGGDNFSGGITVNNGTVVIDNNSGGIAGGTTINAGTVQVGNNDANGVLPAGAIADNGALAFNRNDTALTVGTVISGSGNVTNNGPGTVTLSAVETYTGATIVNTGTLVLAAGNNINSGLYLSSGLTINNGATVQVNTDNSLAGSASPVGSLPVTINAGGSLTGLSTADGGEGTSSHLRGLLTLNGGTLAMGGTSIQATYGSWDLDDGVATIGGPVTSTIGALDVVPDQDGGTIFNIVAGTTPGGVDLNVTGTIIKVTSAADTGIILEGNGTMQMSSANTYAGGTTLYGGILNVSAVETPGVSGPLGKSGTITFGGGTLQYSTNNTFDYSSRFASGGQYNIDTAGQNVTYATSLGGGGGSLTKLGLGTLTLSGSDNFGGGGNTVVANGKLITSTSSDTGNYEVTNDSTLDVQVAGVGAQLNMSSLTLGASSTDTSTLQIDTLATGSPVSAPLNVTGTVTTNGTVNIQLSGTALTAGTFPLISYSGATPFGALHLITSPRVVATLSDDGVSVISVIITAADPAIEWLGGVSGNWDTNDSANLIWRGINSYTATYYMQGINSADAVQFDDNATGTTTVNLKTNVAPLAVTVTNLAKSYTFGGNNAISGATSLVKLGGGTLTILATNTYTGGTILSAGQLNINNGGSSSANSAIGTGPLTINGGVIDNTSGGSVTLLPAIAENWNGDFAFQGSSPLNLGSGVVTMAANRQVTVNAGGLTVGGVISDNGNGYSLTVAGDGALTNSGASTFTGGVNLNGGILNAAVTNALGTGGTISFGGGALQYPVSGNTADYSPRFSSASGQAYSLLIPTGVSITYASAIGSSGSTFALNDVNDTGTLVMSAANSFTGPITVNAGTLRANNAGAFNGNPITEAANAVAVGGITIYHNSAGTYSGNYTINGFGVAETDPLATHLGAIRMAAANIILAGTITLNGDAGISPRSSGAVGDTISGQITGGYGIRFGRATTSASAGSGTITLINTANNWTGDTTIADGTLKLGASGVIPGGAGYGNVTLTNAGVLFNSGISPTVFDLNGFSQDINGLSHAISGTDPSQLGLLVITNSGASPVTLTVGDNDASGNYGGTIADGGNTLSLVKTGSGTQTLGGANNYTGTTTVSDGTLVITGALGAGTVTVVTGAALGGNGLINGPVTIQSGGTNQPGSGGVNTDTLTINNTLNLAGTALFTLNRSNAQNSSRVAGLSAVAYGGTLAVNNAGPAVQSGDVFTLFSAAGQSGSFAATNLPALSPGLGWNWNPANGTLSVTSSVNTSPTNITTSVAGNVLTLSWPADHTGWRLEAQTNSLAAGLNPETNAWYTVSGSTGVNSENITVNPANGTVFYRLVYP